jgi:hypothetical protein
LPSTGCHLFHSVLAFHTAEDSKDENDQLVGETEGPFVVKIIPLLSDKLDSDKESECSWALGVSKESVRVESNRTFVPSRRLSINLGT